jgi:hypothetical protein
MAVSQSVRELAASAEPKTDIPRSPFPLSSTPLGLPEPQIPPRDRFDSTTGWQEKPQAIRLVRQHDRRTLGILKAPWPPGGRKMLLRWRVRGSTAMSCAGGAARERRGRSNQQSAPGQDRGLSRHSRSPVLEQFVPGWPGSRWSVLVARQGVLEGGRETLAGSPGRQGQRELMRRVASWSVLRVARQTSSRSRRKHLRGYERGHAGPAPATWSPSARGRGARAPGQPHSPAPNAELRPPLTGQSVVDPVGRLLVEVAHANPDRRHPHGLGAGSQTLSDQPQADPAGDVTAVAAAATVPGPASAAAATPLRCALSLSVYSASAPFCSLH